MRIPYLFYVVIICIISCSPKVKKTNNSPEKEKVLIMEELYSYETGENNEVKQENIITKIYSKEGVANWKTEKIYEFDKTKGLTKISSWVINKGKKNLDEIKNKSADFDESIGFNDNMDTAYYTKDFYKNELLIKSIHNLSAHKSAGKIQNILIYKYNKDKDLIKKEIYDFNNNFLYALNITYKKNNEEVIVYTKSDNGELLKTTKQLLKKGKKICEINYSPNGDIDSVYYANTKIIKEVSIILSQKKKKIVENKYDNFDRIIEMKEYRIRL